jgi:hypothetical protein
MATRTVDSRRDCETRRRRALRVFFVDTARATEQALGLDSLRWILEPRGRAISETEPGATATGSLTGSPAAPPTLPRCGER